MGVWVRGGVVEGGRLWSLLLGLSGGRESNGEEGRTVESGDIRITTYDQGCTDGGEHFDVLLSGGT